MSTNTMLPAAMSFEEWQELGPMGSLRSVTESVFDRGPRDDQRYPGSDREDPVREYSAHVKITYRHPLANPARERDLSEHEAGHALLAHYRRILLKRDAKALQLFNELARAGNNALVEAAQIHRKADARAAADLRQDLAETRVAKDSATAAELAEESASMADQLARGDVDVRADFTVVAQTRAEAEVVRKMIDYALTVIPPETRFENQKLLVRPDQLPSEEELRKALDAARPPLFSQREDKRKLLGIISSLGAENVAVQWAKAQDKSLSYAPGPNRNLWQGLIDQDKTHYRVRVDFERSDAPGRIQRNNEKVIREADQVVVFWNSENDRDAALEAAATAARRGKLYAVFDHEGRRLDVDLVAEHAMKTYLSRVEAARAANTAVFDIPAGSPEGRLGLSLIRGLPRAAADAIAHTPFTINEVIEMAQTPEGQAVLYREHKISGQALRILSDEQSSKILSDARENLQRILNQCRDHKVTIIGPESFPKAYVESGKTAPVLFVKADDPFALREIEKTTALLGDEKLLPLMARPAAELATALDRPGITLVQVEDQGMPRYVPEKPSVLVLSTGHALYGINSRIEWTADEKAKEIRGVGKTTEFSIRLEEGKVVLRETRDGKTETALEIDPATYYKNASAEEAKTFAVRRAKDVARNIDEERLHAPIEAFRQAIIDKGGFVVSELPPVEKSSVWSAADKRRVSIPSMRNDETRGNAVELAARLADTVVVTQLADRSVAVRMVPVAAELGRPMVAITPPKEVRALPEVGGNIALIGVNGRELPDYLGLSGTARSAITAAYGDRRAAAATGQHMAIAADKVAGMVEKGTKAARQRAKEAVLG